ALQPAAALDHLDPVLTHQALDALPELVDDAVATRGDALVVEADARGDDAELGAPVAHPVQQPGRLQQRLGRDAAHVQAGPAQLRRLDHGRALAELRGADGGGVAAHAAPENDDVERSFRHVSTLRPVSSCGPGRALRAGAVRALVGVGAD